MKRNERSFGLPAAALAAVVLCAGAALAQNIVPSELAAKAFRADGGFSFRVEFGDGQVVLKRTDYALGQTGRKSVPAWGGAALPIGTLSFGASGKPTIRQDGWERRTGVYGTATTTTWTCSMHTQIRQGESGKCPMCAMDLVPVPAGATTVTLSRLSPAVLVETPAQAVAFRPAEKAALSHVALVSGGKVLVLGASELTGGAVPLDEPWVLMWFGKTTPYAGYRNVVDVQHEHMGPDKQYILRQTPVPLDMPILLRLEQRPAQLHASDAGLRLVFAGPAGKVAVMPLLGGRALPPAETQAWSADLPEPVLAQCRLWARVLRDYPLSVRETFHADPAAGAVTVRQEFTWTSFEDAWNSPPVKAAPVPPMLALALGGGAPVSFHAGGRQVEPVACNLMDTPGLAMSVEGYDAYEYRIAALDELIAPPAPAASPPEAAYAKRQLERHVREMIDAGHLAPLFYVYGGIGGPAGGYYYWGRSTELAVALRHAWPHLSPELRQAATAYLRSEWQIHPPLQDNTAKYRQGANRAPYDFPWQDMERAAEVPANREKQILAWSAFAELYGIDAYRQLTGQSAGDEVRRRARLMAEELLAGQDWALMGPVWRTESSGFIEASYFHRNGQASANVRLAGAIGLLRLAQAQGWKEEEPLAWYLLGKLAMARVGQARYVAQLHRMGLVDGQEQADWRTLVHVDHGAALTFRGHIGTTVREDQETPPFLDLVEEVGRLLGRYARPECGYYLDNLDRSMPLYWLSEAPKQSASEQRLCPLQHKSGNVLAQYWVLGKRGEAFRRYVDVTRFKGDLYYVQNLAALLDSYARP